MVQSYIILDKRQRKTRLYVSALSPFHLLFYRRPCFALRKGTKCRLFGALLQAVWWHIANRLIVRLLRARADALLNATVLYGYDVPSDVVSRAGLCLCRRSFNM